MTAGDAAAAPDRPQTSNWGGWTSAATASTTYHAQKNSLPAAKSSIDLFRNCRINVRIVLFRLAVSTPRIARRGILDIEL
jgi:hypothetical protein